MKNKLRILFRYFKSLQMEQVITHINFDYRYIDDWNESFDAHGSKESRNRIRPPKFIINIIDELVDLYVDDFHKYNFYDESEYWSLIITIRPYDEELYFSSECEEVVEGLPSSIENFFDTLPNSTVGYIAEVFEELKDREILQIFFDGRYDETKIYEVTLNEKIVTLSFNGDFETNLYKIIDSIMTDFQGRWWNEGPGIYASLILDPNKEIFKIVYTHREREHLPTEMNILITPVNVKDEK